MLTQPLPYHPPSATYEPIAPARTPTFRTLSTTSSSSPPRKFSFHSTRSTSSTSTTSTTRSNLSKKSLRFKARLHALLKSSSKLSSTGTGTGRGTEEDLSDDDETGSVNPRKARKGRKVVEGNPDAEKMFAWAALGAYACPGAGPLVGWF